MGSWNMTTVISVMRYYMTKLASKGKACQDNLVKTFLISASLVNYSIVLLVIIISDSNGHGNSLSKCWNQHHEQQNKPT